MVKKEQKQQNNTQPQNQEETRATHRKEYWEVGFEQICGIIYGTMWHAKQHNKDD